MSPQKNEDLSIAHEKVNENQKIKQEVAAMPLDGLSLMDTAQRNPMISLAGCQRILIIGRTGSGKTTLGKELARMLNVPHVELDGLYFTPELDTVPLSVLRDRTSAAIAGDSWVTDGNKKAVRDLVWPRADTIIWLDYSILVSLWRLGRRAMTRASSIQKKAATGGNKAGLLRQLVSAAKGVLLALRSHMGQRREFPILFAQPENQHLAVLRLHSPQETQRWLSRVTTK